MSLVTERVSINDMSIFILFIKRILFRFQPFYILMIWGLWTSCAPEGTGILGNQTLLIDIVSQSFKDDPFAYCGTVYTIENNCGAL